MCSEGLWANVWSELYAEYETPDQLAEHMAVLLGLLRPHWRNELPHFGNPDGVGFQVFRASCGQWRQVPDQIKCAMVCAEAPKAIRHYLQMQPADVVQDYATLKKAVQLFLLSGRNYDLQSGQQQQAVGDAMEVDQLAHVVPSSLKGAGMGKDKGQQHEGKGKQQPGK